MMKQPGGEGASKYKGKKSDMHLKEHGGEHSMKGSDHKLMSMHGEEYCGPGAYLKSEK